MAKTIRLILIIFCPTWKTSFLCEPVMYVNHKRIKNKKQNLTNYDHDFTGKEGTKYAMQYRFWLKYPLLYTLHDFALQIYARMCAFLCLTLHYTILNVMYVQ